MREAAVVALEKLGDIRAVEPLISVLKEPDADANTYRLSGAPSGHSESTYVRRRAAEALGRLGDVRAVQPLMESLDYSCGFTRGPQ